MMTVNIILKIILYLTMGYGAYVCWSAFRSSKKKAWLLICIFCLSIFFALAVRASVKVIFHEHYERNRKTEKMYIVGEDGEKIEIKHETLNINLPIFQILLVIGLSFLAEDEIKRNKSEQNRIR
jgi:hypothetical protein